MSAKPLNGLEKAAVLLKSLSPSIVTKVLAHLEPRQAKQLSDELVRVGTRTDLQKTMADVLDEAVSVLTTEKRAPSTETPKAGTQVDLRIADGTSSLENPDADPLVTIGSVPPELLTMALESENARTISLLMNRMEVDAAGKIYKRLSPAKRKEVSLRFTDLAPISDDLLRHIARAVLKKCQSLGSASASTNEQGEREKRMAGLLRSLERTERLETLTALEESDAALAGRIKAMLYLFEDIRRLENSSIQKLLSEIDMKSLASALYGAAPEMQERITSNLSRRAQESLKEEMELSGKVQAAKVKQARETLEQAMQRLDQRGDLLTLE